MATSIWISSNRQSESFSAVARSLVISAYLEVGAAQGGACTIVTRLGQQAVPAAEAPPHQRNQGRRIRGGPAVHRCQRISHQHRRTDQHDIAAGIEVRVDADRKSTR